MLFRNLFYALTTVVFTTILGAGIYEHLAIWPSAFSAPPQSLTLFQGDYKLAAPNFWMPIHPIALLCFGITLALHWKTPRRKFILIPMLVYIVILIVTFSYFVPELMAITGTPYSNEVSSDLQLRGSRWISLSLVRAMILFVIMIVLNYGLCKPGTVKEKMN